MFMATILKIFIIFYKSIYERFILFFFLSFKNHDLNVSH